MFDWYSFTYEAVLRDEHGAPDRVFFGRLFASEALPKEAAAHSERYSALFRQNGDLKSGSVFPQAIPSVCVPSETVDASTHVGNAAADAGTRAGFGEPAETNSSS